MLLSSSASSQLVLFDLACQMVAAAFGPDDQPLQITFKFNPNPCVRVETRAGHECLIRAFPPPENDYPAATPTLAPVP